MGERYKTIDILRGIAITLVVLGHAIIIFPVNLHEVPWCSFVFTWLSSVHMPLFFVISGFCYSTVNLSNYGAYIVKKAKRLLVPYFSIGILGIIMALLLPSLVNGQTNLKDSVFSMILTGGGYWFLYTLFIIFMIFPVLEKVYKTNRFIFLGINVAALTIYFMGILPNIFTIDQIAHYIFYFSVGYIVRKEFNQFRYIWRKFGRNGIIVFVVLTVWIGCIYALENGFSNNVYLNFVASLAGFWVLTVLAQLFTKYPCNTLYDCSKYSLQLYLLNGYLLVVSRTIIVNYFSVDNSVIIIAFNILVTLVLSLVIIKYFISRFKIFRFFLGIL